MKNMSVYQQLQFAIVALFFLAFVVTGCLMIIQPEPSDIVTTMFGELKTLFLGLMSVATLKEAIVRSNGGKSNEVSSPDTDIISR